MVRFLVRAVVAALGLALAAYMLAGVSYDGFVDLLIAAVVLGVVNAFLRPVLFILTFALNLIARQFDEEYGKPAQKLDFVAFLDGRERKNRAVEADVAAFRNSWRRPKWHIFAQEQSAGGQ